MGSDRQLFSLQVAEKLGVKVVTVHGYRSRPTVANPFPTPDGWVDKRTPWWWESTIDRYMAARPGPGARSDLRRPPTTAPEGDGE